MSTIKVTNIQSPDSGTNDIIIDASGAIIIGGTETDVDFHIGSTVDYLKYEINGTSSIAYSRRATTASATHFRFVNTNGQVGSITTSSGSTAFNTSSDYRLKENVVPLTGATDRLNQLQVHRFNFIADPDTTVDGFIAHEAQEVVPECVTGVKDEVDDEGNPIYQGIDQSKLVPLLTAALQEALAEIESLKARVTALEP